jgi:hypothetical protein
LSLGVTAARGALDGDPATKQELARQEESDQKSEREIHVRTSPTRICPRELKHVNQPLLAKKKKLKANPKGEVRHGLD